MKALALVSAQARAESDPGRVLRRRNVEQVSVLGMEAFLDKLPIVLKENPAVEEIVVEMARQFTPEQFVRLQEVTMSRGDGRQVLRGITQNIPILIAVGNEDTGDSLQQKTTKERSRS